MFERFTDEARTAVVQAQDHARRLGHGWIGSEHLLLALVSGTSPAAIGLREHDVTPDNVEEQIVRLVGLGGRPGSDRDALASIGIDLDQVTAAISATFGEDALARAAARIEDRQKRCRGRKRAGLRPGRCGWRARRSSRRHAHQPAGELQAAPATGRYRAAGPGPAGHLPFTARAKQVLERSVLESRSRGDRHIGAEHLAVALVDTKDGIVSRIVAGLGTSPAALNAAIKNRYRAAG